VDAGGSAGGRTLPVAWRGEDVCMGSLVQWRAAQRGDA
jgi:hypothetical protein